MLSMEVIDELDRCKTALQVVAEMQPAITDVLEMPEKRQTTRSGLAQVDVVSAVHPGHQRWWQAVFGGHLGSGLVEQAKLATPP